MPTKLYELKDSRYLGVSVLEILSYPEAPSIAAEKDLFNTNILKNFKQTLSELYKLGDQTTAFELLLLTEKAENQSFDSYVRVFFILRKIDSNKETIKAVINRLQKHFISMLSSHQYIAEEIEVEDMIALAGNINSERICGIVKKEQYATDSVSAYPYYFTDIIPGGNTDNFSSLIETMSETEASAISFQLFPTFFSEKEKSIINELTHELVRLSSGTVVNNQLYKDLAATAPSCFYTYYNERKTSPAFLYNMLVFGQSETCERISSKLISFLQLGTEKTISADFACVDLTGEKINLSKVFPNYVWNINTKLQYKYRDLRFEKIIPFKAQLKRIPYIISLDEAAAFFRLPIYEKSMVALKNDIIYQTYTQFADEVVDGKGIIFGNAISKGKKVTIGCPINYFTKHAMIVGSPGSGKTTFSMDLLMQFYKNNIPFLAIEPTKNEYRAMIDEIKELQIFTPGKNHVSPFIINPFIPPKGIRIEQYISSLTSAFKAAFSMPSPLDLVFYKSIKECYLQYGWKDYSMLGDKGTEVFGLNEFILVFKEEIKNT